MKADKSIFLNIFNHMIPYHKTLGLVLEDVRENFALVRINFRAELVGDPRIQAIHGGVISSAMDAAGGIAASTTLGSMEDKISTVDLRVDFLQSARSCNLIIEGHVVRSGNRIISTYMKAYQEDGQLVAEGRGVFNVRRKTDS